MTGETRRCAARMHIESRECSPQVLERLTGATYFPERLLGPAVVNTVCRGGGHLLYVTAPHMIDSDRQVEYYLNLLDGDRCAGGPHRAQTPRDRVRVVTLDDDSARWLSEKVLDPDSPQAARVRATLRTFAEAHRHDGADVRLSYYEPSQPLERLAMELGVPRTQPSSAHIPLATKHASREIFAAAGIPTPAGSEVCHDTASLTAEVAKLVRAGHCRIVLKLDGTAYGGGLGNALVELDRAVTTAPEENLNSLIAQALPHASLVDSKITWADFVALIHEGGVIAEEMITGDLLPSPSFQGRLTDNGTVEAVSTHDQVLVNGQSYTGCTFPAEPDYRHTIIDYGLRVGDVLLAHGVDRGDYGVDFLAVRSASATRLLGCEVNLRATATKHPFTMTVGLLGTQPTADGRFLVNGGERVYEASDSIMAQRYQGLRPAQLIDAVTNSPLGYDPAHQTGVVLHLMSPVTNHGKFGALCIGTDRAHAARLMDQLAELIDGLTPHRPTAPVDQPPTGPSRSLAG